MSDVALHHALVRLERQVAAMQAERARSRRW